MVKLLSISGKNSLIDTETIPKSTLQLLFLCSIVGNVVFARKDDKTHESKNIPSPTYRFNEEIETGFENDNRNNHKGDSDRTESNWNGMKGVYGYRNSDAFRMMDYIGRNYAFNGKSLEPGVSSSNPSDVIIRGKDNGQEIKGQSNSKVQIKNLIQNHRLEHEMLEQKPEKLMQMNGDENIEDEEEEETTETPPTTTATLSTTTTTLPTIESTTKSPTTTTTPSTTTTSPVPSTISPVTSTQSINNQHREVEGRPSISTQSSMTNSPQPTSSSSSELTEAMKHKKSLHNKLSVHQLISESMPTLQMSVSPIYFYNKQTRSLVAIPYLIMKSTSKMPLLPGMMDSISGSTGGPGNLINYINSPFNQKLRSRPINHLSPLLDGLESRPAIDDRLSDLSYSSSHHDEPETSASSPRWITVQGSGQNSNHGINWLSK